MNKVCYYYYYYYYYYCYYCNFLERAPMPKGIENLEKEELRC